MLDRTKRACVDWVDKVAAFHVVIWMLPSIAIDYTIQEMFWLKCYWKARSAVDWLAHWLMCIWRYCSRLNSFACCYWKHNINMDINFWWFLFVLIHVLYRMNRIPFLSILTDLHFSLQVSYLYFFFRIHIFFFLQFNQWKSLLFTQKSALISRCSL